jgi:hypothetical protein
MNGDKNDEERLMKLVFSFGEGENVVSIRLLDDEDLEEEIGELDRIVFGESVSILSAVRVKVVRY